MGEEDKKWLTTAELSAYLGFDRATISRLRGEGMPHITGPEGKKVVYRYCRDDVDTWLKGRGK